MRFRCKSETENKKLFWHKWFAWYPVRISKEECAWLEYVERRGNVEYTWEGEEYWLFDYRGIDERSNSTNL